MKQVALLKDALAKIRLARAMVKLPESLDTLKAVGGAVARVVEAEQAESKRTATGYQPEGIVGL